MRLRPEVDLILVAVVAEEQHLAAVGDQHQRIVGKGHGIIFLLVLKRRTRRRPSRFQRLVAAEPYSGSGSAGRSSSLSPTTASSVGEISSPASISISSSSLSSI